MSAWLCGNKTLSLCVDVIKSDEFKKEFDVNGEYCERDVLELLYELSYLNTKSLDARYGVSEDNILKDKEYVSLNVDDGQRYKSVCCYLYQTCESEESCNDPLFQLLDYWCEDKRKVFEEVVDNYYWDIDCPI